MAWNDERPRTTWIEQLNLAERLAPTPRLIPEQFDDRVLMFGYCNELCGENGIGWTERLRGVHEQITKPGGDPAGVSAYLGKKYGYTPEIGKRATERVAAGITALADGSSSRSPVAADSSSATRFPRWTFTGPHSRMR